MNSNIQSILEDLYTLDPKLRSHEARLRQVADAVLASRPDTHFDEAFSKRLRERLLACARELQEIPSTKTFNVNFMSQKFFYLAGAAVLAVLIIVPVVLISQPDLTSRGPLSFNRVSDTGTGQIAAVGPRAFGPLSATGNNAPAGLGAGSVGSMMGQSESFASPTAPAIATDNAKMQAGFGGGGGGVPSMIFPPVEYVGYRYVYLGDDLKLDSATVDVLKRIKGSSRPQLSQFVRSFGETGIDLGSFSDSTLQSMSFIQDIPFGYSVYAGLSDGTLSISENWERWYSCPDGVCQQQPALTMDQVPADEDVISLANAFVAEHRIDRTSYGTPFVSKEWRQLYDRTGDTSSLYIPDVLTVTYPLVVEGKKVLDDNGMPVGLRINVNVRFKRVAGAWDLTTQNYQSSAYAAETDPAKILSVAERGGVYGYLPEGGKIVDVNLGTPTVEYVKIWNYSNGISDELLVPALVFPITDDTQKLNLYRTSVIVPLAQELLTAPGGGPVIMPLQTDTKSSM